MFVCDIWKSKIHPELRKAESVDNINRKQDDIFIYRSSRPNLDSDEWKCHENNIKEHEFEFVTFVVNNQHRSHRSSDNQQINEDEAIGYPLLITLPARITITMKQIRGELWRLVQPLLPNDNLSIDDELPFEFWAEWKSDSDSEEYSHTKITDSIEEFDTNQKNMKFIVRWKYPNQYKYIANLYEMKQRPRDKSAPLPLYFN